MCPVQVELEYLIIYRKFVAFSSLFFSSWKHICKPLSWEFVILFYSFERFFKQISSWLCWHRHADNNESTEERGRWPCGTQRTVACVRPPNLSNIHPQPTEELLPPSHASCSYGTVLSTDHRIALQKIYITKK